jgi:glutathione S-transferase
VSLTLYLHPLSSYCQKALIAFYENDTPFEPCLIDLANEASRARLTSLWPVGKFPVLRDDARDRTIAESSVIIEYLAQFYPGRTALVPADPDLAWQTRMRDRFFDLYVNEPMAKVFTDRLRPAGQNDTYGVESAKAKLRDACGMLDREMAGRTWAVGDAFSMADCAAAPALAYTNKLMPLRDGFPHAAAYLERLVARPSFARALREAEPYLKLLPK